jgi:hypothetical protein
MTTTTRPPRRRRQRGIALIIVLGMVVLFFLVAGICLTAGKTARITGKVDTERNRARYAAESMLAYVQWMVIKDRAANPNRQLGLTTVSPDGETLEANPWAADGRPYELPIGDATTVQFRVYDANRGFVLSGARPSRELRNKLGLNTPADENAEYTDLDLFLDALTDYIDSDDLVSLHGRESADYEREEDLELFPRNAPLTYIEEAYWLPHLEALLPELARLGDEPAPEHLLRIIPPPGAGAFPAKPSFFSSPPATILALTGITTDELALVLQARQAWYDQQLPIREGLGDLFTVINREFDFSESGFYTFDVVVRTSNGDISRRVTCTMELGRMPRGGTLPVFQLWRRLYY